MTAPRPPRPELFYQPRGRGRLDARRSRRRRIGAWAAGFALAGVMFFLALALGLAVELALVHAGSARRTGAS